MSFTEQYSTLKNIYRPEPDVISIPETRLNIVNCNFKSELVSFEKDLVAEDIEIAQNLEFRYPVYVPNHKVKHSEAIIYLHGLNERTWNKHHYGAQYLAEKTGKCVILFPLSYHMNRGLPEWSNHMKMEQLMEERTTRYNNLKEASFFNAVLSERFTDKPERFFASGYQSAQDIIELTRQINTGEHPLFEKNTHINFFSYSIGCFILQTLIIAMPDQYFGQSKFVFFAGGSVFSGMNGMSKLILDSKAFQSIFNYYTNELNSNTFDKKSAIHSILNEQKLGIAFSAMIMPDKLRKLREKVFKKFEDQMLFLALQNDHIMPLPSIIDTIGDRFPDRGRLKVLHFDYPYTHENPFPVLYKNISTLVDDAFLKVYQPTSEFLLASN